MVILFSTQIFKNEGCETRTRVLGRMKGIPTTRKCLPDGCVSCCRPYSTNQEPFGNLQS